MKEGFIVPHAYEANDIVDCYFIVFHDEGPSSHKRVVGWSLDKNMIEFYLQFHKCKRMVVKKVTGEMQKVYRIMDENTVSMDDEINIYNIDTIDREKHKLKTVQIPATQTEMRFMTEEVNTYWSSHISYGTLNQLMSFVKPKYQDALRGIYLNQFVEKVVSNWSPDLGVYVPDHIMIDQLRLLVKSFPGMFGI